MRYGWIFVLLLLAPHVQGMQSLKPLECKLTETPQDHFLFYREQMVYHSEQFVIFQNFKGRVSTQVDVKTGKLIRTTYIGEPFEPFEPKYQILFGFCPDISQTLQIWMLSEVPYDN
ncbi:hypothetical protein AB5Q63_001985 [Vibrio parahaemolyticus]|uniref:hypothetical protein n=1 Tax=Vibrio parahaemolyticus TaxID=670 RepID=UPI001F3D7E1D|nr:hypothetical protein [Vibrio parahaemolyticus]EGV1829787.1 hypothetical protein [Vibrio parahaemolyticus]EHW0648116.1 hypothetical protein [Vibrio parahaemolyticus]MCG0028403.1 hypothetical protein [Vibrio parahaemolyticus]